MHQVCTRFLAPKVVQTLLETGRPSVAGPSPAHRPAVRAARSGSDTPRLLRRRDGCGDPGRDRRLGDAVDELGHRVVYVVAVALAEHVVHVVQVAGEARSVACGSLAATS